MHIYASFNLASEWFVYFLFSPWCWVLGGVWLAVRWCERLPGSQQQRQAVVAELLVEALGAGGGGIHQAGVGGAPLPGEDPGVPRQQRLKL